MPVPDRIFCNHLQHIRFLRRLPKKPSGIRPAPSAHRPLSQYRSAGAAVMTTADRQAAFRSAHNLRPIIADNFQARNAPVRTAALTSKFIFSGIIPVSSCIFNAFSPFRLYKGTQSPWDSPLLSCCSTGSLLTSLRPTPLSKTYLEPLVYFLHSFF